MTTPTCKRGLLWALLALLFAHGHAIALEVAKLDAFLGEQVRSTKIPGLVAIVVDRNSVIYHAAFGSQDVARDIPMSKDTVFSIASMTKPIAATAVMMLVEDGKLGLDDTVGDLLPAFKDMQVVADSYALTGEFSGRPATTGLTIRHLLSHSSGLAYGFCNDTVLEMNQGQPFADNEGLYLLYDPGTSWSYGTGIAKASLVLQQITGQSLDDFLARELFAPLGMHDTAYTVPGEKLSRVSTSHEAGESGLVEVPVPDEIPTMVSGDYGLWSTAADYARFIQLFLNSGVAADGTRILADDTVKLIGENQLGDNRVTLQDAPLPATSLPFPLGANRDGFGLGFQLTGNHNEPYMRAPGSMSWSGIFNTHFWIDRQSGIGAVLLMQYLPFYDEDAIATLKGFEQLIYAGVATR